MSERDRRGGGRAPWVDYVDGLLRSSRLGALVGKANAAPMAHLQGGPLGIDSVRRAVAAARLSETGTDVTVSATAFEPLDQPLRAEVLLTGRPVTVEVAGVFQAGVSGTLVLDVQIGGTSVSGVGNGIAWTQSNAPTLFHGVERVMAPRAGRTVVEVVAKRATANGTVYCGTANRVLLLVTEE